MRAGERYPSFEVADHEGRTVRSGALDGWLLLYWFPRSDTPGCTAQALGLRDQLEAFDDLGCTVLGATFDERRDAAGFHARHHLGFAILCEGTRSLAVEVGAATADAPHPDRVAHLVAPDGTVAACYAVKDPSFFAECVLDDLERFVDGRRHG